MDKQELLAKLNKVYGIAQEREALYSEYDQKINSINSKIDDLNEVKPWQRIIGGAIAWILFSVVSFFGDAFYVSGADEQSFMMKIVYAAFVVVVVIAIVIQVFMMKIVERTKWYQNKMVALKEKEEQIKNEYLPKLFGMVKEGIEAFPELGQGYHTTRATHSMINYLQSGRADTIKELIEAYELDCHRERVEANQDRIMYEIEEQQKELNYLSSQVNYVTYYKN